MKKRILLLTAVTGLLLWFCETRNPAEPNAPAQIVFSGDSVVQMIDSTVGFAFSAILLDEGHGIVDDGDSIFFRAKTGVITQVALVAGGIAHATYFPKDAAAMYIDTLTAYFLPAGAADTVKAIFVVTVLPRTQSANTVASISLSITPATVDVKGGGGGGQGTVTSDVRDGHNNKIKDGTPVIFEIIAGPGGGENINDQGSRDTVSTVAGSASVTFNSGTQTGLVQIRVTSGPVSKEGNLTVTAGPAKNIGIDPLEETLVWENGKWKMTVLAALTDTFNNPVKNNTSVLFTMKIGGLPADKISILNGSSTPYAADTTQAPDPGVAGTVMKFATELIYDTVTITAQTTVAGGQIVSRDLVYALPLPPGVLLSGSYKGGGPVRIQYSSSRDTAEIQGILRDPGGMPVSGASVCIRSPVGVVLDTLSVHGACGVSDSLGSVIFLIAVDHSAAPSDGSTTATFTVDLFGPLPAITAQTSFPAVFQ